MRASSLTPLIPSLTLSVALTWSALSTQAQSGANPPPNPDRPPAPARGGRGPGGPRGGGLDLSSTPLAHTEAEKKAFAVLDEMGQAGRGMMSVPREDGRLLRLLAESLGARQVVELGTSHGYSGIWTALALRQTGGKLVTFEIDATRANLARTNFKRAGVDDLITLIEGDAHQEVRRIKEPVDLVFIDADKEGYLDYLNKLLPLVRPGGLIVAHNMTAGMADPAFVKAITTNPALETIFVSAGSGGISVSLKKR